MHIPWSEVELVAALAAALAATLAATAIAIKIGPLRMRRA